MGEAKRRKAVMGEAYGKEKGILPWLPITSEQLKTLNQWVVRGTWAGIVLTIAAWVTIRFIGPSLGWWNVQP